ncbi:MAG: bifunctional (p)ppGpp synthetase/guanosine-3',5'-bis(diphosphate) 3'-pyrophosphohydrolase [Gammaproteobacteria bacterium]|nr:bifunctional (p)ppGpp synthetase/guanosine-3',5'-bis(diphosphate) 3'-pyrophosphohydrolase [Gammaproteobacteria bacterium]
MVSVTTNVPQCDSPDEQDIQRWLETLPLSLKARQRESLKQACDMACQAHQTEWLPSGESGLKHILSVAEILVRLGLDSETLVAAILHDILLGDFTTEEALAERFGTPVAHMVSDMTRIATLNMSQQTGQRISEAEHKENLRRMVLSIGDDIRVVLIVLAERLHEMRMLKHLPESIQLPLVRETEEIYAPLANRLGIWHIKWELEDLCLRYLHPDEYKAIARKLDGRRVEREKFIGSIITLLREKLAAIGIKTEITGRPKHIYSIWKKMRRKAVDFDQIFDLRAVRILVGSVADCYAALGIVHGIWRYIPGEFDDYIATPKANLYRSIHTAVIGPGDRPLEIQIRTYEMHEHAELGVAAHWRYKESGKQDAEFERRITLMRNWLEMREDTSNTEDFVDNLKSGFESRQVYVLTPQGKVIELPKGATAVDFAYAIHSDVGHRCRGVRLNGRIATLTQPLKSGQTVDIITTREGGPSRDWLSPHLGYLKTSRARNRVRHWLKQKDYEQHVNIGRASLDKEINRLGVAKPDLEAILDRFNFKKTDDLLAAIGRGEVSPVQVAGTGIPFRESRSPIAEPPLRRRSRDKHEAGSGDVVVEGVGDLMTHMSRCCKPVPPDDIVGFITRGRGISIHRQQCSAVLNLSEEDQARLVEVNWAGRAAEAVFPVDIQVHANDRKGLLRDISSVLTNEDVAVTRVHSQTNRKTDHATLSFTIEITDMHQLSRLIDKVTQLSDVFEVRRKTGG